mgnify:CR=1 FL=1
MSKIKIRSILENKSNNDKKIYNLLGIKTDNKINYLEENMNVSIIFDNNIKIIRKDEEKEIILEFVNNKYSKCQYKVYGNIYELDIYTNNMIINDNYIEIDYNIEEDNIIFKLYIE